MCSQPHILCEQRGNQKSNDSGQAGKVGTTGQEDSARRGALEKGGVSGGLEGQQRAVWAPGGQVLAFEGGGREELQRSEDGHLEKLETLSFSS